MNSNEAVPPPYNEKHRAETANTLEEKSRLGVDERKLGSSTFGPSAGLSTSTTRRLKFDYDGYRARHGTITDAHTSRVLYTSEHRYRKPTFALNAPDGRSIATASSHTFTNKFDAEVAGHSFELTPRNKLGMTVTYTSPSFSQQLTWERGSCWTSGMKYTLLDQHAVPIACFLGGKGTKSMPWGSFGDLELAEERDLTEAQIDEVVATGLMLAYRAAMNHNAGVTAAVAS